MSLLQRIKRTVVEPVSLAPPTSLHLVIIIMLLYHYAMIFNSISSTNHLQNLAPCNSVTQFPKVHLACSPESWCIKERDCSLKDVTIVQQL